MGNQHCQYTGWLLFWFFPDSFGWWPDWHLWATGVHTVAPPCCCCCLPRCVSAVALPSHAAPAALPSHNCCVTCCSCCVALLLSHFGCHGCCIHTGWLFIGRMCWCQCQVVGWILTLMAIKMPPLFFILVPGFCTWYNLFAAWKVSRCVAAATPFSGGQHSPLPMFGRASWLFFEQIFLFKKASHAWVI